MKSFAAVALLAGSAVAGTIGGLTFPNNFPGCGNVCVSQTIGTSDCYSSGDLKGCACKLLDPANYAKDPCIRDNCSPGDVPGVLSGVQSACGGKPNTPPQSSSKQSSSSSSSAAAQQTSSAAAQHSSASYVSSVVQKSSTAQQSSSAGSVTAPLETSTIPSTGASQASKTDAATGASKTSSAAAQPTKSNSAAGVAVGGMAVVAAAALAL